MSIVSQLSNIFDLSATKVYWTNRVATEMIPASIESIYLGWFTTELTYEFRLAFHSDPPKRNRSECLNRKLLITKKWIK